MLNHQILRAVFLCIFVLLSPLCIMADEKDFSLGGKPGKTNAIITEEKFELAIDTGSTDQYTPGVSKRFKLMIGDCEMDVKAFRLDGENVTTEFKRFNGSGEAHPTNLKSFTADPTGVTFIGGNKSNPINCTVTFGEKKGDKYYVPIELTNGAAEGFKLSSTVVKMGELNNGSTNLSSGLSAVEIAGIAIGCVAAVVFLCASIGVAIFFATKKKRAQKQQEKEQLMAAKRLEAMHEKTPEVQSNAKVQSNTEVQSNQIESKSDRNKVKKARKEKSISTHKSVLTSENSAKNVSQQSKNTKLVKGQYVNLSEVLTSSE